MAKSKKRFDLMTVVLVGVIVILVFGICFVAFGGFSKNPAESDNLDVEFQALIDNGDYKSAYEHMLDCGKCEDPDSIFETFSKFKCVTKTDLDGNLIEETKYVFDKKGDILQETVTTASYDKYNVNEHTYEYYEDGTKKYKKQDYDTSCYEAWFDEKGSIIKKSFFVSFSPQNFKNYERMIPKNNTFCKGFCGLKQKSLDKRHHLE